MEQIDRREFSLQAILAMLSGVTITVSGCGSGTPSSPGGETSTGNPTLGAGDVAGTISGNHGHTAVITSAQLAAGNGVTLNIQGASDHPHTVTLAAGEIVQVSSRTRVSKESSRNDAHTHTVTFN